MSAPKLEAVRKLVVICAWCQTSEEPNVSHGICPACAKKLRAELGSVGKGGGK